MNNLLRAELYKLKRNNMFWTLLVSMTLWGILHAVLISLAAQGVIYIDIDHGIFVGGPESGPKYSATGIETFLHTLGAASNPFFLSLLLGIFAGFFISNEYTTGVMKNAIICGRRRGEIFLAKFIIFLVGVVIVWLIFPLIAASSAAVTVGFGEVDSSMILLVTRVVGLAFIVLAAFSALLTVIGILVEESGKTIILSIVIISGLMLFFLLGSSLSGISFVYEYTIFSQISAAFSTNPTSLEWIRCLLVGLISLSLFSFIGIRAFGRKEIK